jgi:hypothetical protein
LKKQGLKISEYDYADARPVLGNNSGPQVKDY